MGWGLLEAELLQLGRAAGAADVCNQQGKQPRVGPTVRDALALPLTRIDPGYAY